MAENWVRVRVNDQILDLMRDEDVIRSYPCSTAAKGIGELKNSGQTPRGWHVIRARIGEGVSVGSVFVGRRPTGEIWSPELAQMYPQRDWILTRILWLSGLEPGLNRLGHCDTMQRYIYIHGTPPIEPVGVPGSHGCIRMHEPDLLDLFGRVQAGTRVLVQG